MYISNKFTRPFHNNVKSGYSRQQAPLTQMICNSNDEISFTGETSKKQENIEQRDKQKTNINGPASSGSTNYSPTLRESNRTELPLFMSMTEFREMERLKKIASQGEPLDVPDQYGDTPMTLALARGHDSIIKMLSREYGIDVNTADAKGFTPIIRAAAKGQADIIKLLNKKYGVDVNASEVSGFTPMTAAALFGQAEIIKMLNKKYGVDVNASDGYGFTPMVGAAFGGKADIIKLLHKKFKVDVHAPAPHGFTPMTAAAWNGQAEIIKLLAKEYGVDINAKDNKGDTPFTKAAGVGEHYALRALFELGVDPLEISAYSIAKKNGLDKTLELLELLEMKWNDCRGANEFIETFFQGKPVWEYIVGDDGKVVRQPAKYADSSAPQANTPHDVITSNSNKHAKSSKSDTSPNDSQDVVIESNSATPNAELGSDASSVPGKPLESQNILGKLGMHFLRPAKTSSPSSSQLSGRQSFLSSILKSKSPLPRIPEDESLVTESHQRPLGWDFLPSNPEHDQVWRAISAPSSIVSGLKPIEVGRSISSESDNQTSSSPPVVIPDNDINPNKDSIAESLASYLNRGHSPLQVAKPDSDIDSSTGANAESIASYSIKRHSPLDVAKPDSDVGSSAGNKAESLASYHQKRHLPLKASRPDSDIDSSLGSSADGKDSLLKSSRTLHVAQPDSDAVSDIIPTSCANIQQAEGMAKTIFSLFKQGKYLAQEKHQPWAPYLADIRVAQSLSDLLKKELHQPTSQESATKHTNIESSLLKHRLNAVDAREPEISAFWRNVLMEFDPIHR